MLTANPGKRISLADVVAHPWTSEGYNAPPSPQIPERQPLTSDSVLDPEVLEKMKKYGFSGYSQNQEKIITNGTPEFSIYYLIKEHLERKHLDSIQRRERLSQSEVVLVVGTPTEGASSGRSSVHGRRPSLQPHAQRQRRLSMGVPTFIMPVQNVTSSNESNHAESPASINEISEADISKEPIPWSQLQKPTARNAKGDGKQDGATEDSNSDEVIPTLPKSRKFRYGFWFYIPACLPDGRSKERTREQTACPEIQDSADAARRIQDKAEMEKSIQYLRSSESFAGRVLPVHRLQLTQSKEVSIQSRHHRNQELNCLHQHTHKGQWARCHRNHHYLRFRMKIHMPARWNGMKKVPQTLESRQTHNPAWMTLKADQKIQARISLVAFIHRLHQTPAWNFHSHWTESITKKTRFPVLIVPVMIA